APDRVPPGADAPAQTRPERERPTQQRRQLRSLVALRFAQLDLVDLADRHVVRVHDLPVQEHVVGVQRVELRHGHWPAFVMNRSGGVTSETTTNAANVGVASALTQCLLTCSPM